MGRGKQRYLNAGGRNRKHRGKSKKSKTRPTKWVEVQWHPEYGEIPLVRRTILLQSGGEHSYQVWDPDFKPTMPRGAVRGNIKKQRYCCDPPRYYFVDIEKRCVACAKDFVFSAEEQKFWYETLKFQLHSAAIRCIACRKKARRVKAAHSRLALALRAQEAQPKGLNALMELAEATLDLRDLAGAGDLNRALSCSRKAIKLCPDNPRAQSLRTRCQAVRSMKAALQ